MLKLVRDPGTNNVLGAVAVAIALGAAGGVAYGSGEIRVAYTLWGLAVAAGVFAFIGGLLLVFGPETTTQGGDDRLIVKQKSNQRGKNSQSTQQSAGDNSRNVSMPGGTYNEAPPARPSSQYPKSIASKDATAGIEYQGIWWQLRSWWKYREASDWSMVMEARCLSHRQHLLIRTRGDGWVRPATDPNTADWGSYAASFFLKCAGDPSEHPILLDDEWRNVSAAARTKFDRAAEIGEWRPPNEEPAEGTAG